MVLGLVRVVDFVLLCILGNISQQTKLKKSGISELLEKTLSTLKCCFRAYSLLTLWAAIRPKVIALPKAVPDM